MSTDNGTATLDRAAIDAKASKAEQAAQAYLKSRVAWTWPSNARAVKGATLETIRGSIDSRDAGGTTPLFNYALPSLRALRSYKTEVAAHWQGMTVPWVEPGWALIPKGEVEALDTYLVGCKSRLDDLRREVQADRPAILDDARKRRGQAFLQNDYPADLGALFGLDWSFDVLAVPESLKALSGALHASQVARHQARLLGALQLAEEGFLRQLGALAADLCRACAKPEDGQIKRLRTAVLENVRNFCQQFGSTVKWGCDDLQEIVEEAGNIIDGLTRDDLARSWELRSEVEERMNGVAKWCRLALLSKED